MNDLFYVCYFYIVTVIFFPLFFIFITFLGGGVGKHLKKIDFLELKSDKEIHRKMYVYDITLNYNS